MKNILKVDNLNYKIKHIQILDDVTFHVPKGKLCAFLGKNGAGKSTTIKCILGLIKNYDGGGIKCDEQDLTLNINRKFIAYVPENIILPKMSSIHFLLEQAEYLGLKRKQAIEQIKYLCTALDFPFDRLKIATNHLSAGLKKIIMLIQSFLGSPKLLIMDEPTDNLDFETRLLFYKLILNLKQKGVSFLISTHNLYEVSQFADWYVSIKNGRIISVGSEKPKLRGIKKYETNEKE